MSRRAGQDPSTFRTLQDTLLCRLASDKRLRRFASALATGTPVDLTRESTAKLTCLEAHYFSQYFRRVAGISFAQFCMERRVLHALELMELSRSIEVVALAVGYHDRRGLERAFRRTFGKTPLQLQDQIDQGSKQPKAAAIR